MSSLRFWIVLGLAAVAFSGCASYASTYRPPLDGRARVVWDRGGSLVVEPAGLVLTPECAAAIRALYETMPIAGASIDLPAYPVASPMPVTQLWTPVYYGSAPAAATGVSAVPTFFWVPGLHWNAAVGAGRYGAIRGGALERALTRGVIRNDTGGGGGGRGGAGDKALAAAIAIAIFVLPIVDVSVAATPPIAQDRAAMVTDLVGAWNDLARTPGSPCSMPGGAEPLPPELTSTTTTSGSP